MAIRFAGSEPHPSPGDSQVPPPRRPEEILPHPPLILALTLRSLLRHKLRSALTMLGLSVGIASVIVIVALGDGAARLIEQEVRSLGSNLILVIPPAHAVGGVTLSAGSWPELTPGDVEAVRREVAGIKAVSPAVEAAGHLTYGGRNWAPHTIKGMGEEYPQIKDWAVAEGSFFSPDDVESGRRVCVLGETVREALFGTEDAAGALVRIGNVPFQVAGVLERRGYSAGEDQDDVVIAPWTTVRRTLQGSKFDAVDFLLVSGRDEGTLPGVARELAELLRDRHPASGNEASGFRILSMADVARMSTESGRTMTAFLGVIASISLVVGGVGILNIMLVSVAERTPEIGLRLAVGARRTDILGQFLCEGLLTALLAGAAGIALGTGVAIGIGSAFDWPIAIAPGSASLAVLTSAAVGLLSGAYPSVRASRLDPIIALRGR